MIKVKITNGEGFTEIVDLPQENLWIEIADEDGTTRHVGSLFFEEMSEDGPMGAIRTTLGRTLDDDHGWEDENGITV